MTTQAECWHGSLVESVGAGWRHPGTDMPCDDPAPYVPDRPIVTYGPREYEGIWQDGLVGYGLRVPGAPRPDTGEPWRPLGMIEQPSAPAESTFWTFDGDDPAQLPPDLTGWHAWGKGIPCPDRLYFRGEVRTTMYVCTRHTRHTGRHAAGDGAHVLAVWS